MSAGKGHRAKRFVAGISLSLTVLLLAACGVRIDTQLTVDSAGAGSRVMTLTLSENLDSLLGGAAAADASIIRHKPAEIDYTGLTTGPAGELITTFTVNFASPAEYTSKMVALLAASDQEWTQDNAFVVEQSLFIQGASIEEEFDSQDLLEWMFAGLLADGVVDSSNSGDMFEMGATTVTFDGIAYKASSPISFSQVTDHGFNSITMETAFEDDSYSRVITYRLDDKAVYNSAKEVFDEFFAGVSASGAAVVEDTAQVGVTWVVSLSADSPERLVELTNAALLSEETAFQVTAGMLEDDPATSSVTVVDYAECSAICSPDAPPIAEALTAPAAFTLVSENEVSEDGAVRFEMSSAGAEQLFHAVYLFDYVTTELTIGLTGELTWNGEFVVSPENAAIVGEGFKSLLAPVEGERDVDVSTSDADTIYTVTITGSTPQEFTQAYRAWSGQESSSLTLTELPDANLFSVAQQITGDLGFSELVISHLPTKDANHSIVLPFGQSFDVESSTYPTSAAVDGARLTVDGPSATFSATAAGTTLIGLVAGAVLLLAALGAVLVAVLMRKKIAAAIGRKREARERPAQQPAADDLARWQVDGGAGTMPPVPAPPAPLGQARSLDDVDVL